MVTDREQAELYCLHVLGMDDVHPAPDRATAQLWAAQWTVFMHRRMLEPRSYDPIISYVVAPWPWDADAHAAGLAKSIADNTFPADPLAFATEEATRSVPVGAGVSAATQRMAKTLGAQFVRRDKLSRATPAKLGEDDVERVARGLLNLKGQFERIAAQPPSDQPAYANGTRPFGTGDLRHFIQVLAAAIAALPAPDVVAGQTLREALAKYDTDIFGCPYTWPHAPPSSQPCTKCRATASEGCGLQYGAALQFMGTVRSALAATPSPGGGEK